VLPNTNATNARLMLKAENNPFFAVNTADFDIAQAPLALVFNPTFASLCPESSVSLSGVIEYQATADASNISFLNLPSGLSATPTLGTLSNSQTLDITFNAAKELVAGTYSITALVESGALSNSLDFSITILPDTLDPPTLVSPSSGNTAVFLDATLEWSAVNGASTYKVEVSETPDFNGLYYSNTTSFTQDYLIDLAPDTTYFWRVIALNDCGGNSLSEVNSFTTTPENTQTKSADLLPLTIGSNIPNTINASIEIKEDLPLASLEASLDIAHSYLSDLVVKLYAPSGKVAVLIANSCGQGENLVATFSDTAPAFNCANDPAITGFVKPLGSFEIFRGDSIKGVWRLEIEDVAEADGGALNLFEIKIAAAGNFRPDADNDGVYDDGADQCLNTPAGVEVDTKGCAVYRLNPQNFRVSLKSQSCLNVSDGSVEVTVAEVMDYVVYVKNASGAQINQASFTSFLALENMTAGNYTLCFEGTQAGITYEQQCFEVRIGAPEPLAVTTAVSYDNGGALSVNLAGNSRYFVSLNGQSFSHEKSQLTLALQPGINSFKVITGLDCQGVYEEQIFYTPKPLVYPNPLKETLYIQAAVFEKSEMKVQIFTLSGSALATYNTVAAQTPWRLDTSLWDPGVYIVRIELDGTTTSYKVLKE
jgi:subtilisin-like proprotein convertase family protein